MRKLLVLTGLFAVALFTMNCEDHGSVDGQRADAVRDRAHTFEQAERVVPVPKTENFPLRRALAKFTERQDLLDHPWYIYILGDNGNMIGYYVAQTVPINACNFLSSTEDIRDDDDGNLIITAPSLDGIFYGGGGASGACDAWFFFDAATDAQIQIRGVNFFVADQPLRIEAKPITVATP